MGQAFSPLVGVVVFTHGCALLTMGCIYVTPLGLGGGSSCWGWVVVCCFYGDWKSPALWVAKWLGSV